MSSISTTEWFCIGGAYLAISGLAMGLFLSLARRAVSGRPLPSPSRTIRVIVYRLERRLGRLILKPPSWRDIWQKRAVQKTIAGSAMVCVVVAAAWGCWWLVGIGAQAVTPAPAADLPFVALFAKLFALGRPMFFVLSFISLVGAGASFMLGDARRGGTAFLTSIMLLASSGLLQSIMRSPDESPTSAADAKPVEVPSSEVLSHSLPVASDTSAAASPLAALPTAEPQAAPSGSSVGPASTRSVSSHDDSDFGVTDALVLYGAYRVLTSGHEPAATGNHQHPLPGPVAASSEHARLSRAAPLLNPSATKPFTGRALQSSPTVVHAAPTAEVRSTPKFRPATNAARSFWKPATSRSRYR